MIIQAELRRKQSEYEGEACSVDKVIELPAQRFKQFSRALLADYDFIAENKNAIRHDDDARHCLLILDAEGKDGFLVDPQGYNYARYSAFVPNARSLLTPDMGIDRSYLSQAEPWRDESRDEMLRMTLRVEGKPDYTLILPADEEYLDAVKAYGSIAKKYYGYEHISVIDLRNPTRSDGNNLLTLINRYMDIARKQPDNLAARAKAEKYAKILAKSIVSPKGNSDHGQNAFFYDAAEGLLSSTILLLAEFLPPDEEHPEERRHIVSVFKLVQDLLEPARGARGRSRFQLLMDKLPSEHKARWLAGAALNSSEQAMASVMSTVLSRLNSFLDSELEQILCFDSAIDAEKFAAEKSAIFLILPEEDQTKNFMAGLMIQNLSRELFAVADENGGKLKNRVILFCDELGTMPPFDILPLFSAGRSRRLTLVPIIQSLAQLEKNYGKEGASILMDNCQDVICGGFAPNSEAADTFSKALGSRTVLSGSVSRGKNDPSQSLQMMERPLLTADELKSIPKGSFIVQKTGCHPVRTCLRLFLEWGITFEEKYRVEEQAARKVYYADQNALTRAIVRKYPPKLAERQTTRSVKGEGQLHDAPVQEMVVAEDIDYDRMPHKRTPYNLLRQGVDR